MYTNSHVKFGVVLAMFNLAKIPMCRFSTGPFKCGFIKRFFSDNTKEVSFKLNRLFLLQACYEYTESNLSWLENRWKRTSKLKQTKNLHGSPGSVLSFHSSRQTAMKQAMEFHDAHSQNLNG